MARGWQFVESDFGGVTVRRRGRGTQPAVPRVTTLYYLVSRKWVSMSFDGGGTYEATYRITPRGRSALNRFK